MDDPIIIGEGVILDVRPASFLTRGVALIIDYVLYWMVVVFAIYLASEYIFSFDSSYGGLITGIVLMVVLFVIVPSVVENLTKGRSLGKWAMGVRVVRDDGGPVVWRHSLIRHTVGVLEIVITAGAVAIIVSLFNQRGKRVGDFLAGTYVIRVRNGKSRLHEVLMPQRLVPWAQAADIAKLPDGLALNVRQFLSRAPNLHPHSRESLGAALAEKVSAFVAPAPPFAVSHEEYLAAVIVERGNRDLDNELRRREMAASVRKQIETLPFS